MKNYFVFSLTGKRDITQQHTHTNKLQFRKIKIGKFMSLQNANVHQIHQK